MKNIISKCLVGAHFILRTAPTGIHIYELNFFCFCNRVFDASHCFPLARPTKEEEEEEEKTYLMSSFGN